MSTISYDCFTGFLLASGSIPLLAFNPRINISQDSDLRAMRDYFYKIDAKEWKAAEERHAALSAVASEQVTLEGLSRSGRLAGGKLG